MGDQSPAFRHAQLRADALSYILNQAKVDVSEFIDFFAERLLQLSNCDGVVFHSSDGRHVMRARPGVTAVPTEACSRCPFHSHEAEIYASGFLEIDDCQRGICGQSVPAECPAKSALVRVVRIHGRAVGLLSMYYLNKTGAFPPEDRQAIDLFAELLGRAFERIQGRRTRERSITSAAREHARSILSVLGNEFSAIYEIDLVKDAYRVVLRPETNAALAKAGRRWSEMVRLFSDECTPETRAEVLRLADIESLRMYLRDSGRCEFVYCHTKALRGSFWRRCTACANAFDAEGRATRAVLYVVVLDNAAAAKVELQNRLSAALEQAKAAERAKSTFLATMSHEIRTPLNAVIGFADFLRNPDLTEAERKTYLDGITKSSKVLLDLINDILDLSKIDSGKMDVTGGACDVRILFDEMNSMFRYRATRNGIALKPRIASDFPVVGLREERVRQILVNLVGNAMKFTHQGEIDVSADFDASEGKLTLKVRDTGIGIPSVKLSTIFDPFVQDGGVRGGKVYQGTGLGLPICKRLAEAAGGSIAVTSEVNRGSEFVVTFPHVEVVKNSDPSSVAKVRNDAADAEGGRGGEGEKALKLKPDLRVVLVDDVPMNLLIIRKYVESAGVPVKDIETYLSAQDAFSAIEEGAADPEMRKRPLFVCTDMWMPKMTGEELARALRKSVGPGRDFSIVAATADVDTTLTFDMSLFDAIVQKPLTGKKIRDLIAQFATEG